MNQFLQENLALLIIFLLAIVLILISLLIGLVIFLVYKKEKPKKVASFSPQVEKDKKSKEQPAIYCDNHPDKAGVGTCAICEQAFCEKCLMEYESLRFCPEHFQTYTEHDWIDITNIKTTPTETENAVPIYQLKKKLWVNEKTPTFIQTHYKINMEGDFIESYVKLYVREEDRISIETQISSLKTH